MNIAIITGASSGLGKVFTETIINRYPELDEVWVLARRTDRLKEIAQQHPNQTIRAISCDVTDKEDLENFHQLLETVNPTIKVLINNAGFDRPGLFRDMDGSAISSLIEVNITGMTMVTKSCLPYMSSGSFAIITGSIGSFAPLPYRAVYSASKAYVRFFARALREEESKRGVNIMLLSPGNMATEMFQEHSSGGTLSLFPTLNLEKETLKALQYAEQGRATYTPLFFYKFYRLLAKLIPTTIMVKFTSVESSIKSLR